MQITNKRYLLIFGVLATSIYLFAWQILLSPTYRQNPDIVSAAITFDMTLTVALLYYFMVIRKRKSSPIQLVPVLIISTILASVVLPNDQERFLGWIKYGLVFSEFFVITYLAIKIRDVSSAFQKIAGVFDFIERLNMALFKVLCNKSAADIISSELSMFYYAFTFNKQAIEADSSAQTFTYHKQNGYSALFWVFIFLVIVEGIVIHLILSRWSFSAAIILGVLNLYALVFLLADYSAIRKRPIQITEDMLMLRSGLRWRADIPLVAIAEIELSPIEKEERDRDMLDCSLFSSPDIVVHLNGSIRAKGIYGFKKDFSKVSFNVDELRKFTRLLNTKLSPRTSSS